MPDKLLQVVIGEARTSGFPAAAFEGRIQLHIARTDEELRGAVQSANVLFSWKIPPIIPAEAPHLRWIQLPSAGVDHIRGLPVWESDVVITASQGIHTVPMAEHVFALTLSLTRHIPALVRAQDRRQWRHDTQESHLRIGELRGKTMGIIGWGKIGDGIAHLARAFGMRVVGTRWSILVPREVPERIDLVYQDSPWIETLDLPADIVYPAPQLQDVLAQSDVIVVTLPLTDETRGSLGTAEFGAMKSGAIFINVGRGAVVEETALVRALQSGKLAGAGLDVFGQEPLAQTSPLWAMPNVIVSPHIGGVSDGTLERAVRLFAANLTRYLADQPLLNVVERARGY